MLIINQAIVWWYARKSLNPFGIWINRHDILDTIAQFIRSAKVSNAYFSVAILTYAMLTLALHMLTLVC